MIQLEALNQNDNFCGNLGSHHIPLLCLRGTKVPPKSKFIVTSTKYSLQGIGAGINDISWKSLAIYAVNNTEDNVK